MTSRWFNVAVALLWLASMSWLTAAKVLPPLLMGDPPNYRTILDAQRDQPPVAWRIMVRGRRLGWAVSTTSPLPDGRTHIHNRVHFDQIPLEEIAPEAFRPLLQLIEKPIGSMWMNSTSTLEVGADGRLSRFDSAVRISPLQHSIELSGLVTGNRVRVSVRSGEMAYSTESHFPSDAMVGSALSPQTQLPGLKPGQRWTVPAYSPLMPPNSPMEILQATVEGYEPIVWNGSTEWSLVVVYRSDPGSGLGSDAHPRGKLWVRPDGTVLRQQVLSAMVFERMTDEDASDLEREASALEGGVP